MSESGLVKACLDTRLKIGPTMSTVNGSIHRLLKMRTVAFFGTDNRQKSVVTFDIRDGNGRLIRLDSSSHMDHVRGACRLITIATNIIASETLAYMRELRNRMWMT